ncbi:MAG: hypothetical protein ABIQ53_07785 [Terracoccus sp.]
MPGSTGPERPHEGVATRPLRDTEISPHELAVYEHVLFTDTWSLESVGDVLAARDEGDTEDTEDTGATDRAADVLASLVERNLLRPSQQDESRLVPSSPLVGLGRVASAAEQDLLERTQYAHHLRMLTSSLMERFEEQRSTRSAEGYEVLSGRDATVTRVSELLRGARSSVDTVVTTPPTERALEQARIGDLTLLERGIAARGLYLESHRRQSPRLRDHLTWLSGLGAQVRVAGMLPVRFMLIDHSVAVVAVRADDSSPGAVIVHTEGLVHLASALFEMVWESSVDVADLDSRSAGRTASGPARRASDGSGGGSDGSADSLSQSPAKEVVLGELEIAVLRLMAKGNKDLAVSRRTGLSVRSVRRLVATLSEQVGAESRFELALRCRERGLI